MFTGYLFWPGRGNSNWLYLRRTLVRLDILLSFYCSKDLRGLLLVCNQRWRRIPSPETKAWICTADDCTSIEPQLHKTFCWAFVMLCVRLLSVRLFSTRILKGSINPYNLMQAFCHLIMLCTYSLLSLT